MKEYIRTFKEACTFAGDVFAQILIALLIFIPALLITVILMELLSRVGLVGDGKGRFWPAVTITTASYLVMTTTWLFSKYGTHPRFLSFCQKHPLLGAVIKRTVEITSNAGAVLVVIAKGIGTLIEAAITLLEGTAKFIGKAIAVIIFAVVVGVILYFFFGALATTPWWAIVIIYLLLNK